MDKLSVCGMFTTKLVKLGSNFFIGTDEFPCNDANSFCLVTTTSGKSKLALIFFAVKKKITKKKKTTENKTTMTKKRKVDPSLSEAGRFASKYLVPSRLSFINWLLIVN